MKNKIITVAGLLILGVSVSLIAAKITEDNVKIGNPATASDKVLEFDTNDSTNNTKIYVTDANPTRLYLKSPEVRVGRGIGENIDITAENSASNRPRMRYNNSLSKWQFADDGLTFLNMNEETPVTFSGVGVVNGMVSNLSVRSAGTNGMKISSSSGSALTSGAPGLVVVRRTGGVGDISLAVESDVQWDTAGLVGTAAADYIGAYDTTAATAFETFETNMVIHACNLDDTNAGVFFMMYHGVRNFMPSSANDIGYIETAPAVSSRDSVFVMKTGITTSNYVNKNCIAIGAIRLKKNSSDVWRVADAVSGGQIAVFGKSMGQWTFTTGEPGHFGATATTFFTQAGGPVWASFVCGGSTPLYVSQIKQPEQTAWLRITTSNCGAVTNGANGSELRLALIFQASTSQAPLVSAGLGMPCGQGRIAGVVQPIMCKIDSSGLYMSLATTNGTAINNNSFTSGTDDLELEMSYIPQTH